MEVDFVEIDDLINRIEKQLNCNIYDLSINQVLIEKTQILMMENAELRVKLGPLIGKLKTIPQPSTNSKLKWIKILNGHIAIGHRPKIKSLKNMKMSGATHIFTLLSEKEGARDIEYAAKNHGLQWLWLPLGSAEPPEQNRYQEIDDIFKKIVNDLKGQAKIYIHCSAGIHRTGMITYALFRYIGLNTEESESQLLELRNITEREVGNKRKTWGDQFYNHLSLS